MTRLFPEKASESRAESAPRDVLVDPDAVRELSSGLSSYRDFIRQLPAHLSKHILSTRGPLGHFSRLLLSQPRWEVARSTSRLPGMLDRNTLNRCASVSQHWAALAHQVRTDLSVHSFIQHQLAFLQVGPSGRSRLPTSPSLRRGWPGRDPFRPPQTLSWPPAPGGLPFRPNSHWSPCTSNPGASGQGDTCRNLTGRGRQGLPEASRNRELFPGARLRLGPRDTSRGAQVFTRPRRRCVGEDGFPQMVAVSDIHASVSCLKPDPASWVLGS